MSNRTRRAAPIVGLLFVAAYVAVALLLGPGQDATTKSAEELVAYYRDNHVEQTLGAVLIGVCAIALLFWTAELRSVLRDAEGPSGNLSAVAFAGAIVFVGGSLIGASIHIALADYANNTDVIQPQVFQTLNAFDWSNFLFFPVGLGTLLLASGLCSIRHGAFPKWLGWTAIVLAITFTTPALPVGLFGTAVWVLVLSIVWLREAGTPRVATASERAALEPA